jgi:hypothetical protein
VVLAGQPGGTVVAHDADSGAVLSSNCVAHFGADVVAAAALAAPSTLASAVTLSSDGTAVWWKVGDHHVAASLATHDARGAGGAMCVAGAANGAGGLAVAVGGSGGMLRITSHGSTARSATFDRDVVAVAVLQSDERVAAADARGEVAICTMRGVCTHRVADGSARCLLAAPVAGLTMLQYDGAVRFLAADSEIGMTLLRAAPPGEVSLPRHGDVVGAGGDGAVIVAHRRGVSVVGTQQRWLFDRAASVSHDSTARVLAVGFITSYADHAAGEILVVTTS